MKPKRTVAALDLGSSKICAVVAGYFGPREQWKVLGQGFAPSAGIKKGKLLQVSAVSKEIAQAVSRAAKDVKYVPSCAVVSIPSGVCRSVWREEKRVFYSKRKVSSNDIDMLHKKFPVLPDSKKDLLIKAVIDHYRVDAGPWLQEPPIGALGESISVSGSIFYIDEADAVQWRECLRQAGFPNIHFGIASEALIPHIIKDHPKTNSWLQLDMGAGLVQAALIKNGKVLRQGATLIAGNHLVNDLMYGITIELPEARHLLHEHGQADGSARDEELVPVVDADGTERTRVSKAYFYRIIAARIREIFSFVQEELDQWKKEGFIIPEHIVLCGGLSLLNGIDTAAAAFFNKKVDVLHEPKTIAAHIALGLIAAEDEQLRPRPGIIKRCVHATGRWLKEFV